MNILENQTILVTGATGFIGSHLVNRLSAVQDTRLLLLSRQSRVSEEGHIRWLRGSLNDLTEQYWKQAKIPSIDVVFHLGAFIPKLTSEINDHQRIFADNLNGTRTLLEGLPLGIKRIIFSSTVDVYAPLLDGEFLTELSRVEPAGLYGASKLFCERLIANWATGVNCHYSTLRYGHIFGPGEESYSKLIPQVIRQLLSGETPDIYGNGMAERDFLHVNDAVEATIRSALVDGNLGPVNIVRGESRPIRDIVETLLEKSGSPVEINYLPEMPEGHSLRFNNEMMRKELGTWSMLSLADGLEDEILKFRM
jgi:nucleoside-diphosphate-sugar epimerase